MFIWDFLGDVFSFSYCLLFQWVPAWACERAAVVCVWLLNIPCLEYVAVMCALKMSVIHATTVRVLQFVVCYVDGRLKWRPKAQLHWKIVSMDVKAKNREPIACGLANKIVFNTGENANLRFLDKLIKNRHGNWVGLRPLLCGPHRSNGPFLYGLSLFYCRSKVKPC